MKVWLLVESHCEEDYRIVGIYTKEELAKTAMKIYGGEYPYYLNIEEHELDEMPRP